MILLTAFLAGAFAAIHLFIDKLRFLDAVPRSRWLSAAGGVAVAYVFLHILPELSSHQQTFADGLGLDERTAEMWVYLVALAGLGIFYGLERAAKLSRSRSRSEGGGDAVEAKVFWLHIVSFSFYNVLIGYLLLHREETGLWSLFIYFVAMGLHFVTNDFGMRDDHRDLYDRRGRWFIAAAVLIGWTLGVTISVSEIVIGFLFAFLAGGVVLNVLKEELPEERKSRFLPFAIGLVGYATLLLFA
ncbi:hypothetical protein EU805_08145 [Salipiger sp. IMCC34102]|uniref:hypothetical protein n=1 Tax=Salipiger sp. IMCC34102 TaxID=2510647 RepID=UPI00101C6A13|nr:hypothetical protein [Salipiger sp. IMCC34102]RYH02585.1 hypothetical protein EU805_08145 [Salipiger sp. IMCC34102]